MEILKNYSSKKGILCDIVELYTQIQFLRRIKKMDWSTKRYTKFRKKYEIEYRYYDKNQLDTEEFNLKEQLVDLSSENSIIFGLIGVIFGGYFSLFQIEKFRNVIGFVIAGALIIFLVKVFFSIYHCHMNKRYRLRLEILKKEKRYRKVKSKKIINLKKARSI